MTELSIRTTSFIYKWIQKLTQKNPCKAHSLCSCFASCQPIDRCKLLVNNVIISGFIDVRRESHHILVTFRCSDLWFWLIAFLVRQSVSSWLLYPWSLINSAFNFDLLTKEFPFCVWSARLALWASKGGIPIIPSFRFGKHFAIMPKLTGSFD